MTLRGLYHVINSRGTDSSKLADQEDEVEIIRDKLPVLIRCHPFAASTRVVEGRYVTFCCLF